MDNRTDDFERWYARNHPFDWFKVQNGGRPVPFLVRMSVWALCRAAWVHRDVSSFGFDMRKVSKDDSLRARSPVSAGGKP